MKSELTIREGTVLAVFQNLVCIYSNGQFGKCQRPDGKAAANGKKSGKSESIPAELLVGDRVELRNGIISAVAPRRNHFSRRAAATRPGGRTTEQKIAANIDQVIAVLAAQNPAPKWNLLDRYLAAGEAADLPVVICMSKLDLVEENSPARQDLLAELAVYQRMGYPVLLTSAATALGLAALAGVMLGKTSLMIGKSGVGKSSLMNTLYPQANRGVGEVGRESGKGRHTTSNTWMQVMDDQTALIDTPGTREFGLWFGQEEDLAYTFREMRPYLGTCRFGLDCRHDEEPGCAIRQAVIAGNIHPRRYQSYLRLLDEEADQ
jgi:ribosome biogenesis GTPase / thiamine phosphate phosphatase